MRHNSEVSDYGRERIASRHILIQRTRQIEGMNSQVSKLPSTDVKC